MLILWLIYSKEPSPSWEPDSVTAVQEIPRILWSTKFYYRIHQEPATGLCPQPAESSVYPLLLFP
jgi:hypothetical protein